MADLFTRATLLRRLKDPSDETSWSDFRDTYAPYVNALLRRYGLNGADAEDLLQDLMLVCWRQLPKLDYDPGRGSFRGWLMVCTRNAAMKFHRRHRHESSDELAVDELRDDSSAAEAEAEEEWRAFISAKAWEAVSRRLNPDMVDLFKRLAAGETPEAAAARTGLAQSSVYVYKQRVIQALQKEILRLERELL
ncbi:MAG: hypothetical protein RL095_6 [Verrucomicrobiota bacterium]|jgi:RNA polymerase sigma-70 factor (ECF subfamily)